MWCFSITFSFLRERCRSASASPGEFSERGEQECSVFLLSSGVCLCMKCVCVCVCEACVCMCVKFVSVSGLCMFVYLRCEVCMSVCLCVSVSAVSEMCMCL